MNEEIKNKAKEIADKLEKDLKDSLGDLYTINKDKLSQFLAAFSLCQAMVWLNKNDETLKESLEFLNIGLKSLVSNITYQASEEGMRLFKELFTVAIKAFTETLLVVVLKQGI